jgi:hypothetical protein
MQGNNLTVVQAQPLASNKLGESIKSNFFDKFEDDNEKTRKSYNKYREAYAELYGEGDKNFIDINSSVGRFKGYKSWDELAETLKKQKKEESKPDASTVYVEGFGIDNLFESPVKAVKTVETVNQDKIQELKPLNIREVVRGLPDEELDEGMDEGHKKKIAKNIIVKYNQYKKAYERFYDDKNYDNIDSLNEKGGAMNAAAWGVKATAINKKIKQYGTSQNQKNKEEVVKNIIKLNKKYEGLPTYEKN